MKRLPIGILGSGKGSNCRAILERIRSGDLAAEARVVISDVFDAPILDIAREFSIPNAYLAPGQFRTRLTPEAEGQLVEMLREAGVQLVVLAGFMRVLHAPMLQAFPRRIINIHPSLLPRFPGLEAWKQALAAGESVTGCTVHYIDEKIDHGQIIARQEVAILPNDTPETLHARIQIAEREFPCALRSRYPFGHRFHRRRNLSQRLAASETSADRVIAAAITVAGHDQIACAAQSIKGIRVPTHGNPKPNELGQRSSDQCRFRIIAQFQTIADPCRQGEDIF